MTVHDFQAFLGRERELALLTAFTAAAAPHPTLGVVCGRRRVGKSALLQSLVHDEDGFYHHPTRATSSEALVAFALDLSAERGAEVWVSLEDAHPPELGETRPAVVVSNSEQNTSLPSGNSSAASR